jgi:trk system potassium uptake protein TrkA
MKFTVIGLGMFGYQLALELATLEHEVIAIDQSEKIIEEIKDQVTYAACADATDKKALEQLGVLDTDAVFVALGEDFATSLLVTAHLQELGAKRLLSRVLNPVHERLLKLMGVEELVLAEQMAARQLAKRMGIRGASRHFGLDEDHALVEMAVPGRLIGKTLAECDLRNSYEVNLVTVKCGTDKIEGVPSPDLRFQSGDQLLVFGHEKAINSFSKI